MKTVLKLVLQGVAAYVGIGLLIAILICVDAGIVPTLEFMFYVILDWPSWVMLFLSAI